MDERDYEAKKKENYYSINKGVNIYEVDVFLDEYTRFTTFIMNADNQVEALARAFSSIVDAKNSEHELVLNYFKSKGINLQDLNVKITKV